MPWFRSPLRRDPIIVFWLALLVLAALVMIPSYVTVGRPFRWSLFFAYVTTLLGVGVWTFLLLALFPAWLRRSWAGGASRKAGYTAAASAGGPRGHGGREWPR